MRSNWFFLYFVAALGIGIGFLMFTGWSFWTIFLMATSVVSAVLGKFVFQPIDEREDEADRKVRYEREWNEIIPRLEKDHFQRTSYTAMKIPYAKEGWLTEKVKIFNGGRLIDEFIIDDWPRRGYGYFDVYYYKGFAVIIHDSGNPIIVMASE